MKNHEKPALTAHERLLLGNAKSSYKKAVRTNIELVRRAADVTITQMISGAIPNWGGMKIQGIQLNV